MSARHRPANRRAHETIAIDHEQQRYKIGLGRELVCVDDGAPEQGGAQQSPSATGANQVVLGPIVEVFLNAQQVNSQVDVLASDGAILMSMLLQYGCPPADIFHAMKRNPDGSMSSPLGRAAAFLVETPTEGECNGSAGPA